jgi:hypothetical protein
MQIKLTLYISRVIRLDYKTLIVTTAGIFYCLQHQKLMIYIRTHVFNFFFLALAFVVYFLPVPPWSITRTP